MLSFRPGTAFEENRFKPALPLETLEGRVLLSAVPVTREMGNVAQDVSSAAQFIPLVIRYKQTITTITVSSDSSTLGQPVTLSATVTAVDTDFVPNGSVSFAAGKRFLGRADIKDGVAKISTSILKLGTSAITATYDGTEIAHTFLQASTSAVSNHVVTLPASTIKLSITTPDLEIFGNTTGLLARVGSSVDGATPTGRVVFYDGGTLLGSKRLDGNGHARWQADALYTDLHVLKAIYLGDSTYLGHRSAVRFVDVELPTLTTASDALKVGTVTAGTGSLAAATGDLISANYTLFVNGVKSQSSSDTGVPFRFEVGATPRQVIKGVEEGLTGAKSGEKRVLVIPPSLGYGSAIHGDIPADSTLVFVFDVLSVTQDS